MRKMLFVLAVAFVFAGCEAPGATSEVPQDECTSSALTDAQRAQVIKAVECTRAGVILSRRADLLLGDLSTPDATQTADSLEEQVVAFDACMAEADIAILLSITQSSN